MSGIYIQNMEMPKSCSACKCVQRYLYSDECALLRKPIVRKGRLKDCPLVEVTPHGRLVDSDALAEHIKDVYCKDCKRSKVMCKACECGDILDEIEDAPTIIEAST